MRQIKIEIMEIKTNKSFKIWKYGLRPILQFILFITTSLLNASNSKKSHKPTLHEITNGEKLPFTGEYFVPEEKYK